VSVKLVKFDTIPPVPLLVPVIVTGNVPFTVVTLYAD
jgi:hypothetical protein